MRLFTLFTYLKTKESYDRWITRRVWEFRQQISKAKYLKMSVGNIRKFLENTAALYTERKTLQVSVIRRSGYVYPEKLKCPPLPSCCEISGCKMSVHGIPDMKCRRTEFLPGWTELCCAKRDRLRVQGVGTPLLDDTECARLSGSTPSRFSKRARSAMLSGSTPFGFPQGEAHGTHEHHTRTIAYPIRICCPDY